MKINKTGLLSTVYDYYLQNPFVKSIITQFQKRKSYENKSKNYIISLFYHSLIIFCYYMRSNNVEIHKRKFRKSFNHFTSISILWHLIIYHTIDRHMPYDISTRKDKYKMNDFFKKKKKTQRTTEYPFKAKSDYLFSKSRIKTKN